MYIHLYQNTKIGIASMASSPAILTLLLFLLHFHYSSQLTLSVENLNKDVIVSSPKGTFTAGFTSVGQNAYCFGIWYTQPQKTIVWMANRDSPVNGKRSKFSLLKNGNVVLTDAGQFDVWSTATLSSKPLELHLFDTGNLVLREQSNKTSVLWQSFDFPTDTLLPGQILTRFTKLVSSRSEGNYSSGFYKLFFDNDNVFRLLYEGPEVSSVYWPDPWLVSNNVGSGNGRSTYNSSRVAVLDNFGNFGASDHFTFKTIDYGILLTRRLTLDHDGNVRFYSRNNGQENWLISGLFKLQPCFIHGICGPNSICSYEPISGRKCTCLEGYNWIDNQDWSLGCKPSFQPSCDNKTEYHFLRYDEVDFYGYDYGSSFSNYTYKQCEKLCSELCDCMGFQYTFARENGLFWCYPKTQLLNGHWSPGLTGQIFLRLPKSIVQEKTVFQNRDGLVCSRNAEKVIEKPYVKGKENGSLKFMLWFATGLGGFEVVCIFMVWFFLFRSSNHLVDADQQGYVLAAATGFRRYTYSELKQATKGFKEEIGRGAGGIVYKGVLSDNRVAAIKKLHEFAEQGESEFLTEVSIIGRLNHMNLIGMWGYCVEGKHKMLVYEYMENGSLASNLPSNALDWSKRYNIAVGMARGLAYLHEECLEWILHCDIKPQNILLDSDYQPKVADFGLSKPLDRNKLNNSSFSRIRGTRGYMAPEWVFNLQITSKVDVYSYGIVVLEMVTGRSPMIGVQVTELGVESHNERLATWAREKRRKASQGACWVEQIVDPTLGQDYDMKQMEILATVALECVEEDKDVRPSMSQVVERLQSHNS